MVEASCDDVAPLFSQWHQHIDRPCLIDAAHGTLTYGDVFGMAADFFAARSKARQLLFIEGRSTPAFVIAYVGAIMAGHVVHVIEPDRKAANDALIARYRPQGLIQTDGVVPQFEALQDQSPALAGSLQLLLATSGTTGSPRLVKLTRRNIASNTAAIITYLDIAPTDRSITTLKPFYSYGLSVINTHLSAGASLILTDHSLQEQSFWDLAARYGATNFAGVPHSFELLRTMEDRLSGLDRLRFVTQAGGRLAPGLVRHFAQLGQLHGWRFFVMYGQTEAAPRISYLPPDQAKDFPQSIGMAIPGGKMWLVDSAGKEVGDPETEGELLYAGANVMVGYAESAADLARLEAVPHLATGDMAMRLPNGLFVLTGRKSRFVKPFGLRISLDAVESFLAESDLIAAAHARDETIVVFVSKEGRRMTTADIAVVLADHYALPASIFDVRAIDAIPLQPNGKTDRQQLDRRAANEAPARLTMPLLQAGLRSEVWREFKLILRGEDRAASVLEAYAIHFSHRPILSSDSFVSLGGDSMNAVTIAMLLEDHIGELPYDWPERTIADLGRLADAAYG